MKRKFNYLFASFAFIGTLNAQHNNELYNYGALIHVQAGAEVHVWGDVHMREATGNLQNNGLIKVQGHSYSDNLFQQSGTGTYRVENSDVNIGERQFIQGSYAVRGGQAQTGVNDGSFYDLELANDQGIVYLVGTGNIADVRNSVDYNIGATHNRIVTHDIGATGAIIYPANGSAYSAVFGVMNPTAGLATQVDNSTSVGGNMSTFDAGYVQGNLRRAINAAGGQYGYVLGLEPAGAGAQRGHDPVRAEDGLGDGQEEDQRSQLLDADQDLRPRQRDVRDAAQAAQVHVQAGLRPEGRALRVVCRRRVVCVGRRHRAVRRGVP